MNKQKITKIGSVFIIISMLFTYLVMPINVQAYDIVTQTQDKGAKTGLLQPSEEQKNWFKNNSISINSVDSFKKYKNSLSKSNSNKGFYASKAFATVSNESIPSKVDNSSSKYFPSIVAQIGGSCVSYSTTYYCMSYMVNRALDRSATADNTMSPNWTYNLTNDGYDDGSNVYDCMKILKSNGCLTNSELERAPSSIPSNYYTDYHANGDLYEKAKKYQIDDILVNKFSNEDNDTPITSNKDSDLDTLKKMINEGYIFTFSTDFYKLNYVKLIKSDNAPENTNYVGESSIYSADQNANGPHHMALVGYNDDIWTDVNLNGKVDAGEMGALKVANSHGKYYENGGYVWLSYDALNRKSSVNGVSSTSYRIPAIDRYEVETFTIKSNEQVNSDVYLEIEMNSNMRNSLQLGITDANETESTTNIKLFDGLSGGAYGFNGNKDYDDGKFSFNLTAYDSRYTSEYVKEKGIKVKVSDTNANDTSVHTIKKACILDSANNKKYDLISSDGNVVDGNIIEFSTKELNVAPPTALNITQNNNYVTLDWQKPVSNNKSIAGYEIFRNNFLIARTTDTIYNDNTTLNGKVVYQVRAYSDKNEYSKYISASINKNALKIYYKSSNSNVFMQYKIGDGIWTTLPGEKMTESSDKPGYYEKTIDLSKYSKDTTVMACFNNGAGSWDNNGSKNYEFKSGTYTLENRKITPIYEPLKATEILVGQLSDIKVKNDFYIYTNVQGGSGDFIITYCISNGKFTEWFDTKYRKNTIENLEYASEYVIVAYVKDNITGERVSLKKNITVKPEVTLDIKNVEFSRQSPQLRNSNIQIEVNTNSPSTTQNYSCEVYKNGEKISTIYATDLKYNVFNWMPSELGNYEIRCTVSDSKTGKKISKSFAYTIEDGPLKLDEIQISDNNEYSSKIDEVKASDYNNFRAMVSGGLGDYQYKWGCYYNNQYTLVSDYNKNNKCKSFDFDNIGEYTIVCNVKDSTDAVVTKEYKIKVNQGDLRISSFSPDNYEKKEGEKVTLTANSKYNYGKVKYKYTLENSNGTIISTSDYSDNNSISYSPTDCGSYVVSVTAKDDRNIETTSITSFNVTPKEKIRIKTFDLAYENGKINIDMESEKGYGNYKYTLEYLDPNGVRGTLVSNTDSNSYSFVPAYSGTYTIYLTAYDKNNKSVETTKTINVVVEPLQIKVFNVTSNENTIDVSMEGDKGGGQYKYSLIVVDPDGKEEALISNGEDKSYSYKPSKSGKYTFKLKVIDATSNIVTQEKTVEYISSNQVTIYYKGYDNPYIHYKIGKGTWTTVPGMKMTNSTDVDGYPYKAQIEIGDADTLTACFNNGNGSWDNKSGNNYTFKSGYYLFTNGTISKIDKPKKNYK